MGIDDQNLRPTQLNSPSRLPAPRSRKTFFNNDNPNSKPQEDSLGVGHKRKLEMSPPKNQAAFNLGRPCPNTTTATGSVRTFRSNGTSTSRPPVTKPTFNSLANQPGSRASKNSIFADAIQESENSSKKRPAWDTRGRLEDMESLTELLKNKILDSTESQENLKLQLEASERKVRELEELKNNVNATVFVKEKENNEIGAQLNELKLKFETELLNKDFEISKLKSQLQTELESLTRQRDSLKNELQIVASQLQESRLECTTLTGTISRTSATIVDLESQIQALKAKIEVLEENSRQKDLYSRELTLKLDSAEKLIKELEAKVYSSEAIRRKLHNEVQELKGNIRVFCRIRPVLSNEINSENSLEGQNHLIFGGKNANDQEELQVIQNSESANGQAASKSLPFAFDKVFGPSSKQDDVFDEISQLIQSALDGYRVCIFAYGQTGSGKTFTMEGGPDKTDQSTSGMIPRAVRQIFCSADALKEKGWTFNFESSYLEIYNESIRDLLSSGSDDGCKYEIKHQNGKTTVTDLTNVPVQTPEMVMSLLSKAAHNRAVAETQCNDRSSRSHSVFTLKIVGENSITTEKIDGLLNLIDLAGSERLSQSGSTGERLKETQAINKSLSSLGDVIYSLANKDAHVPFRNSKLTYLLQNSLGGNCKTLMFVNVSPLKSHLQETICSLRFATKVNACQIGTARRNTGSK